MSFIRELNMYLVQELGRLKKLEAWLLFHPNTSQQVSHNTNQL